MSNAPAPAASCQKKAPTNELRVDCARRLKATRQRRVDILGSKISRDVPWSILLVLYTSHEQVNLKISAIHAEIDAPITTVLRWLMLLSDEGFITRRPHPTDGRIYYISLTPAGKSTLDFYFDSILLSNEWL